MINEAYKRIILEFGSLLGAGKPGRFEEPFGILEVLCHAGRGHSHQ